MEKKLELYRDFILENTGKDTYFYLSNIVIDEFVIMCKLMNYETKLINLEGFYDLRPTTIKTLCQRSKEFYLNDPEFYEVSFPVFNEELYTKILQIGEEQFKLHLTKTAIEHLKLTGKCKIV